MRRILWIVLALVLVGGIVSDEFYRDRLLSWIGLSKEPEVQTLGSVLAEKGPQPGAASPAFMLQGMDGKMYGVEGRREKPVLLNFWASWCDPCKEEAPELVKLYDKYASQLDIYGINVLAYDKKEKAEEFVKEYGIQFPVLFDEKDKVYKLYNGMAFPTNVLIDKDGIIVDVLIGFLPADKLEAKIVQLLNSHT